MSPQKYCISQAYYICGCGGAQQDVTVEWISKKRWVHTLYCNTSLQLRGPELIIMPTDGSTFKNNAQMRGKKTQGWRGLQLDERQENDILFKILDQVKYICVLWETSVEFLQHVMENLYWAE